MANSLSPSQTPRPLWSLGVSKWLSPFRFSSAIPRLGPLPLLLPVSKRPESIAPIFFQEKGVQSIYELAPACGGSLVARNKNLQQLSSQSLSLRISHGWNVSPVAYFPRIGGYFLSQNHVLTAEVTAASLIVVAYISHSNHCLLDCSYGRTGPPHAYARPKLSSNSVKSCRIPCIAARNPSQRKVHRKYSCPSPTYNFLWGSDKNQDTATNVRIGILQPSRIPQPKTAPEA